jgi:lipoprotein-releasing system ATP-binding protein
MNKPLLELQNIHKVFLQGRDPLKILTGVNLAIRTGEMVGLVGASGSGKSTLLHIAGLLDSPTEGSVLFGGQEASSQSDSEKTQLRGAKFGFVYQKHSLLPEFTALENVMVALMIQGVSKAMAQEKAKHLLEAVGLSERFHHFSQQLSGGEQQRVAIARALANDIQILLADEPTGNLDEHTAEKVLDLLFNLVKSSKLTALIVTHNMDIAHRMDRAVRLHEGKLI